MLDNFNQFVKLVERLGKVVPTLTNLTLSMCLLLVLYLMIKSS